MVKGVLFDLFHTLTDVESNWSDLPRTSDGLGIDRAATPQPGSRGALCPCDTPHIRLNPESRDPGRPRLRLVNGLRPAESTAMSVEKPSFAYFSRQQT
jgi:hypothetical protein